MRQHAFLRFAVCLLVAAIALAATTLDADARKRRQSAAEKAAAEAALKQKAEDEAFAQTFVGKSYSDDLDIDGWGDLGGGRVQEQIYVHQYQRPDGTNLVLTSKQLEKEKAGKPALYEVTDALIAAKPAPGVQFSTSCTQGKDEALRFIGEAKGPESKEWWTDVRRAWEISIETGKITSIKPAGVRCTNASWGQ